MEHNYKGYAGNILHVDLTKKEVRIEPLDWNLVKKFVGGWGINFKLASDLIRPNTDPLSPENPIILGVGPFVGAPVPGSAKVVATTKFPLPATPDGRNYITTAISGSRKFAHMMKKAGFDHVIIIGRAAKPAYLNITDDNAEIIDTGDLWEKKDTYETTDHFTEKDGKCGVIAIGRAGENLCKFSMAITDKKGTLGRSGFGAVMGSKNLKAIVAKGTKEIRVADEEKLKELKDSIRQRSDAQALMGDFKTSSWRNLVLENMNPGVWSKYEWDERYGPNKWDGIKKGFACDSCWNPCGDSLQIKDGKFAGTASRTGTYLWVGVVGQKLELPDNRAAIKLLERMNKEGICAATSSSLLDWITRRYGEEEISDKETGGMALTRDLDGYLELLEKIITREGFGDRLAEGWFEASEWMGKDARTDYVEGSGIAKGTDCIYPARAAKLDPGRFTMISNPRGGQSSLGGFITSFPLLPLNIIKMHVELMGVSKEEIDRIFVPADYYGAFNVARLTRHIEDYNSGVNCTGICEIWAVTVVNASTLSEIYSAVTGIDMSPQKMKLAGERAFNLYKLMNVREGFTRSDDAFPEVWLMPRMTPDGIQMLTDYYRMHIFTADDINRLLDDYYDERGWDTTKGIPIEGKLEQLGLTDDAFSLLVDKAKNPLESGEK